MNYKSTTKWIRISRLMVDPRVQSKLNRAAVRKIAAELDPDLLRLLAVSERDDGTFHVMDGQHRLAALLLSGYGSNQSVECQVFIGLTLRDEAHIHRILNKVTTKTALQRHHIEVAEGLKTPAAVDRAVKAAGFKVGDGGLRCVTVLYKAFEQHGGPNLTHALREIMYLWPDDRDRWNASIVGGVALFLATYGDKIKVSTFEAKVGKIATNTLIQQASRSRGQATAWREVAAYLVERYNSGLRSGRL